MAARGTVRVPGPLTGRTRRGGRVAARTRDRPVARSGSSRVHMLCARAFLGTLVLVAVVRVGVVGVDGVRIVVRTRAAALGYRQHGDLVLAPLVPEGSGLVRVLPVPFGVRRCERVLALGLEVVSRRVAGVARVRVP